ncbi:MAG: radical SAM protein [Thermodesulfobacteriota bacterium]
MRPSYLALHQTGELVRRAAAAVEGLAGCRCCPRGCRVDRLADETGICRTGRRARVASYSLHFGEEDPLVGTGGSGTIFFAGCNLLCAFCQNYDISHHGEGAAEVDPNQLARIMLELQKAGAHNVNLVTPTHVVPQILEALALAADAGLALPLVYNSSGYDALDTLALLDGVVDIYMPDAKFWDPEPARRFCSAPDYPERAREAIAEMHRQVGDLVLDHAGIAQRGLLVRHLVMPGGLAGAPGWMRFLAGLSPDTYVNVMDQYRPCGTARNFPEISRGVSATEYALALDAAREAGLTRLDDRRSRLVFRLLDRLSR